MLAKENARNPAWTADYNGLGHLQHIYFKNLDEASEYQVQRRVNPRFKGKMVTMSGNHVKGSRKDGHWHLLQNHRIGWSEDGKGEGKRTGERHRGWSDRMRFRVDACFITTTLMMTMVELQESLDCTRQLPVPIEGPQFLWEEPVQCTEELVCGCQREQWRLLVVRTGEQIKRNGIGMSNGGTCRVPA